MKIPNFDDKDLGIAGLVILGVVGFLVGWGMDATAADLFSFETALALGIAGLATGKKGRNSVLNGEE